MELEYRAYSNEARVCFIVYAKASYAIAARKIFNNLDVYGEFMKMKTYFIPLARYAKLISIALRGELAHFV
jgi:hypothetical protein